MREASQRSDSQTVCWMNKWIFLSSSTLERKKRFNNQIKPFKRFRRVGVKHRVYWNFPNTSGTNLCFTFFLQHLRWVADLLDFAFWPKYCACAHNTEKIEKLWVKEAPLCSAWSEKTLSNEKTLVSHLVLMISSNLTASLTHEGQI